MQRHYAEAGDSQTRSSHSGSADQEATQTTADQHQQHGSSSNDAIQSVTGQHASSASKHHTRAEKGSRSMAEKSQAAVLNVDVLLPDELLSGLLTQCSVQPELLSVMEDLFDSAGETPTSLESTPRRLLTVKPCIEGGCSQQPRCSHEYATVPC